MDEVTPLHSALTVVQGTKNLINTLTSLLPASSNSNFRERLVEHLESGKASPEFQEKAKELLDVYAMQFGVDDL